MPDPTASLPSILKLLDAQPLTKSQTALVIELSEARLAYAQLRPSSIWTYAVVGSPGQDLTWGQRWQARTAPATPVVIGYLKQFGSAPGGIDMTSDLNQTLSSVPTTSPDFILPVGTLCGMEAFGEALAARYPTAQILEAQDGLALPADLQGDRLRQEIARLRPPKVDVDYCLQTVKLNQGQLEWDMRSILRQGESPPIVGAFKEYRLCRAIGLPGRQRSPVCLLIQNSHRETVSAYQFSLPDDKNVFFLRCWFNYADDGLRLRVEVSEPRQGRVLAPLQPIIGDELTKLRQADPPPIQARRYLDLAFIVDGTMQRGEVPGTPPKCEWRPDLEPAKRFISAVLQDLENDPTLEAQCALALYGDYKEWSGAEYMYRPWPFQHPAELRRVIEQGSDVAPTKDLDYEAALEMALWWANSRLSWRPYAAKCLVVIGYAPPHPPAGQLHPAEYGFRHEPFTSPLDWQEELSKLRQKGVQILGVWAPYPEWVPLPNARLDRNHPCMRYSQHVWRQLGGREPYVNLEESTRQQVWEAIQGALSAPHVVKHVVGEIPWPLWEQIRHLRCVA